MTLTRPDKDHPLSFRQQLARWLNMFIWLCLFVLSTGAVLAAVGMPWNTYWAYSAVVVPFVLYRIVRRARLSAKGIDGEPHSQFRQAFRRAATFGLEPLIWALLFVLGFGIWFIQAIDSTGDLFILIGLILGTYIVLFLARLILELFYARWR